MNYNRSYFKRNLPKAGILLFLAFLLFFPASSAQGASKGVLLWFNTLLPTLLPFMILSNLIVRMRITVPLSRILYPLFHRIFRVSKNGCYPVLIGFLSGIPVGAKTTADLTFNREISEEEGQYLLGLCNNASPMFIMSYISLSQLNRPDLRFILLAILYSSALVSSYLFRGLKRIREKNSALSSQSITTGTNADIGFDFRILDKSIMDAFDIITRVGGYVILFSIAAQIISDIWSTDSLLKFILLGFLEITTGIHQISSSSLSMDIKIALITMITAFGGLSGLAQTNSVISNTRLSIGTYFIQKVLHMTMALIMVIIYLYVF